MKSQGASGNTAFTVRQIMSSRLAEMAGTIARNLPYPGAADTINCGPRAGQAIARH